MQFSNQNDQLVQGSMNPDQNNMGMQNNMPQNNFQGNMQQNMNMQQNNFQGNMQGQNMQGNMHQSNMGMQNTGMDPNIGNMFGSTGSSANMAPNSQRNENSGPSQLGLSDTNTKQNQNGTNQNNQNSNQAPSSGAPLVQEIGSSARPVGSLEQWQLILFVNQNFGYFYTIICFLSFMYKQGHLDYMPGQMLQECLILFLLQGIQMIRCFFGRYAFSFDNYDTKIGWLCLFGFLTLPVFFGYGYFLRSQVYVLRFENILNSIAIALLVVELVFAGIVGLIFVSEIPNKLDAGSNLIRLAVVASLNIVGFTLTLAIGNKVLREKEI